MRATQNYHNGHTKFEFGMAVVVILYDIHTLEFTVYSSKVMPHSHATLHSSLENLIFYTLILIYTMQVQVK